MNLMKTYEEKLNDAERNCVEQALDCFKDVCGVDLNLKLDMSDHAARAAEALAIYIINSRPKSTEQRDRIEIPENIEIQALAVRMNVPNHLVVKTLFKMGIMATINSSIDHNAAALVAEELGFSVTNELLWNSHENRNR
jgi:hypothetical protein